MWSPTHPALFACVDLAGRLDLWNLNNDTEVHTHTHTRTLYRRLVKTLVWKTHLFFFQVPTASVYVEGGTALNRVRWAHSGKEIATGDSEGQVQVYDVGEVRRAPRPLSWSPFCFSCRPHPPSSSPQQICVPKADEWTRFVRTLAEINENRDEAEELANV